MEIIDLLFELVDNYVSMKGTQKEDLRLEMKDWRTELRRREIDGDLNKFEELYLKIHKPWCVRLVIAVMYLPLANWLTNLNSGNYFDPGIDR